MLDVYLVGCFIGYARVTQNLKASIGVGGYCFVAAAIMSMLTHTTLDRRTVWRAIADGQIEGDQALFFCTSCDRIAPPDCEGQRCRRCGCAPARPR